MFESLFGQGQYAIKMLFAFIIIFGVLALALWLLRRFGGERLGNAAARGRQPRLALIDQANVDSRRRLILVRRDNVEHLLLIGGPSDVVVEPNIVRGSATAREPLAPRPAPAGDTLPRAVPLGEGNFWPLQPEPAAPRSDAIPRAEAGPRSEPLPRPEPAPRSARTAAPPSPREEAEEQWETSEPQPAPPAPPVSVRERYASNDPVAGLADELAREPSPNGGGSAAPPRRQPPRRDLRSRGSPTGSAAPVPAGQARLGSPADQTNLAEMAQRLEAALRRPARGGEVRPAPAPPAPEPELTGEETDEVQETAPAGGASHASRSGEAAKPGRSDSKSSVRADGNSPPQQKSFYDSLEQEMASLLGRPGSKPE